jgi:hypothetical protein
MDTQRVRELRNPRLWLCAVLALGGAIGVLVLWGSTFAAQGPPCQGIVRDPQHWDAVNAKNHLAAQVFLGLAVATCLISTLAIVVVQGRWRFAFLALAAGSLGLVLLAVVSVIFTSGDRICP